MKKEDKVFMNALEHEWDGVIHEHEDIFEVGIHTDGGVEMWIVLHKDYAGGLEEQFNKYVEDFDVDEEIELHRQDERYKNDFTIRESLDDFEAYRQYLQEISQSISNRLSKKSVKSIQKNHDIEIDR